MEMAKELNTWLAHRRPSPQVRLRLFCFPYAGGSASIFGTWPNYLSPYIEVCPIQLPGRETRFGELPFKRLASLVDTLAKALLPALDKPFAFFGHSMGALIGFELARYLRENASPQPVHLFVSGARAPHLPDPEPPIHQLPNVAFLDAIRRLNGTTEEVLAHAELIKILLPYLRADFEICETYIYQPGNPLSIPVTVFGGRQDTKISLPQLEAWRNQTLGAYFMYMFSGDHFFLHDSREQLLQIISESLKLAY